MSASRKRQRLDSSFVEGTSSLIEGLLPHFSKPKERDSLASSSHKDISFVLPTVFSKGYLEEIKRGGKDLESPKGGKYRTSIGDEFSDISHMHAHHSGLMSLAQSFLLEQ